MKYPESIICAKGSDFDKVLHKLYINQKVTDINLGALTFPFVVVDMIIQGLVATYEIRNVSEEDER